MQPRPNCLGIPAEVLANLSSSDETWEATPNLNIYLESIVCGIAGIVGTTPWIEFPTVIHQMCETIVHRGPDDEGIYAKDKMGRGMRSLGIIDVAGGEQPIYNEDKTIWVVFNGEIYNFLVLREELIRSGHGSYTDSDTQVIVHLYEEFGAECIGKLRGMFGLALYDERRCNCSSRGIALAKSRSTTRSRRSAAFSVRDQIFARGRARVDRNRPRRIAAIFLFWLHPRSLDLVFRRKLPPGYLLEFVDGFVVFVNTGTCPHTGRRTPLEEEYLEEMEERLAEAVTSG